MSCICPVSAGVLKTPCGPQLGLAPPRKHKRMKVFIVGPYVVRPRRGKVLLVVVVLLVGTVRSDSIYANIYRI